MSDDEARREKAIMDNKWGSFYICCDGEIRMSDDIPMDGSTSASSAGVEAANLEVAKAFTKWLEGTFWKQRMFAMPAEQREREREREALRQAFLAGVEREKQQVVQYVDKVLAAQQENEARHG